MVYIKSSHTALLTADPHLSLFDTAELPVKSCMGCVSDERDGGGVLGAYTVRGRGENE